MLSSCRAAITTAGEGAGRGAGVVSRGGAALHRERVLSESPIPRRPRAEINHLIEAGGEEVHTCRSSAPVEPPALRGTALQIQRHL